MAIQKKSDQLLYQSRGPLDPRSLVKTYADLLNIDTWTYDDVLVAYNGMLVAVYLDKVAASNNGIYYLFDSSVTKITHKPDVTSSANWHKLGGIESLPGLAEQISTLQDALAKIQSEVDDLQD